MKPSQQKTYDWYIKNTNYFNELKSMEELKTGEIEITTKTNYYLIGKKGGISYNIKHT